MIAFDLTSAVLAELDGPAPEPVEPVVHVALAPLEPAETLGFSSGASGASRKQHSWNFSDDEICFDEKNSGTSLAPIDLVLTGSTGSTGITEHSCGLQRGQLESCTGSTGSFNEKLTMPAEWLEGVRKLKNRRIPAGFTREQWQHVIFETDVIVAGLAAQAAALGWSTADVFGVQAHEYPLAVHGGLLVEAARVNADVIALTAECAVLRRRDGTGTRYIYRNDLPDDLVLIWEAGR